MSKNEKAFSLVVWERDSQGRAIRPVVANNVTSRQLADKYDAVCLQNTQTAKGKNK